MADRRRGLILSRALLGMLPKSLRYHVMREKLKISPELDPRFTFKIAQTQKELKEAYRILHDCYLEMGYTQEHPSGMRIVKYFALPTTTTLIAYYDDRIVGTMSIIRKTALGLPMEAAFDLQEAVGNNQVIAEVSSLAIDSRFRQKRGALFLPLCKFFWEYVSQYMNLDGVVITVNPSMADFYEGFLNFKELPRAKISHYSFANGHPGVGLYLNVKTAPEEFKKIYNHKTIEKNLYYYFTQLKLKNFILPERKFYKSSDPVMSPDMLEYFFIHKADIFRQMTESERLEVFSMYPFENYKKIFSDERLRKDIRYHVNIRAQSGFELEKWDLTILDVGQNGVKVCSPNRLSGIVRLKIKIADECTAEIRGEVRWENAKKNIYGLKLLRVDSNWERFIRYLDSDFGVILEAMELKNTGSGR